MGSSKLVLFVLLLAVCAVSEGQAPFSQIGKTATPQEIKAWNITISNDGANLPIGHGTAAEGKKIYAKKCAMCHGVNGRSTIAPSVIIDKDPHTTNPRAHRVMVTRVPFAPILWDYIRRAMPMKIGPGTLTPNEVYALTAYLLNENGVIPANEVMDENSLPKVKMPNRNGYVAPTSTAWKSPTRKSGSAKKNSEGRKN